MAKMRHPVSGRIYETYLPAAVFDPKFQFRRDVVERAAGEVHERAAKRIKESTISHMGEALARSWNKKEDKTMAVQNRNRPSNGWRKYDDDLGYTMDWNVGELRDGSDDGVTLRVSSGVMTLNRKDWEALKEAGDEFFDANGSDDE